MKKHSRVKPLVQHGRFAVTAAVLFLCPVASYAAVADRSVKLSVTAYLLFALLLVVSLVLFFIFQRRFNITNHELQDLTSELDVTRTRLSETTKELEHTQSDLKNTCNRYQGMLFDAGVGMFQINIDGKCTYVNHAMQDLSGLYLKKAQEEGIISTVHPDDQSAFNKAWEAFVEDDEPFLERFRFQFKRGREEHICHVHCQASKVLNAKKEVESYIGWVTDVSHFHQLQLQEQARTKQYSSFVDETVEGLFRLTPDTPVPLSDDAATVAKLIMETMVISDCNNTFSAMYGVKPQELKGKSISDMQGGCGPFKKSQDVIDFVEAGYKAINAESIKQDPSGNRLVLVNNVVGIIENDQLMGIWGAQRNISQQKRETAELTSQLRFMNRILNSLPADVHVKDTRCRYLYASKKLATRTGIPQAEWIGKTINEVIPGTKRDHDQLAVEAMKAKKLLRNERPYEVRGKTGWMETMQIPLVSDEGLVEGVVGLSLEITDRKNLEQTAKQKLAAVETQLKQVRDELSKSREEYGKTATALSEAHEKLKTVAAEQNNREHKFEAQLAERSRIEETLRNSEEALKIRQKELEEALSKRLSDLEAETDKRKKWEELLAIKEDELNKIEELAAELKQQLNETEDFLQSTQEQLIRITEQHSAENEKETAARKELENKLALAQKELDGIDARWKNELASADTEYSKNLEGEAKARTAAENQLARTKDLLHQAQTEMKEQAERHSKELEDEVAERKAAAEKLIQSMEELDELRQQFNARLEEETKAIKNELAQKQIREKALRQNEQDLEKRIKELENTLQMKAKEFAEQIQAREGAEVQKKQIEQRLEQMTQRQQELVARETQKLQLHIAEIRLNEVKLRKETGDLQREKESLEELLQQRNGELEKTARQQQGTESLLNETKSQLKKLADNQEQLIAAETEALRQQLNEVKQQGEELQQQLKQLQNSKQELEGNLQDRDARLEQVGKEYEQTRKSLADTEAKLKQQVETQSETLDKQTRDLRKQLEQQQEASKKLQQELEKLGKEKQTVQKDLETRTQDLANAAREYRKVVDAYKNSQDKLKQLAEDHEAALSEKTGKLQGELEQLQKAQADLLAKGTKLEAHIEEQQKRIEELTGSLQSEEACRQQVEKELQDFQTAVESDKENAEALVQEQTKSLKSQIANLEKVEAQLKKKLEDAQKQVEQRDESLTAMKAEQKQTETRIKEIEDRLAGIQKEHQAEIKKSMAEVKQVSKLNGKLVDELNDTLQSALNPVVKTTILMEKADNLSKEQKQNMVEANQHCRRLIDMMNYRCELTHIADGSDKLESGCCDLHGLITDVDRQFTHRAETKKLFFAVSFAQYQAAHNVPKEVQTDELKLRKILSILLGYAIDQTEKGRLGLHATRKACSEDTTTIAFELAYTGRDAKDKRLSSIFGEGNEEEVDVKYGLTLARRYISMLGGEHTLEYRSGGVTALTLQFPFKKVGSEAGAAADKQEEAGAA